MSDRDEHELGRARRRGGGLDGLARAIVVRLLAGLRGGELVLVEDDGRLTFGEVIPARPLRAVVRVRSARFYRDLLRGSVGLGESYVEGRFECEDLVSLSRLGALNVGALDRLRRALAPVLIPAQRLAGRAARNTRRRARRQIAAHYDLGNELF